MISFSKLFSKCSSQQQQRISHQRQSVFSKILNVQQKMLNQSNIRKPKKSNQRTYIKTIDNKSGTENALQQIHTDPSLTQLQSSSKFFGSLSNSKSDTDLNKNLKLIPNLLKNYSKKAKQISFNSNDSILTKFGTKQQQAKKQQLSSSKIHSSLLLNQPEGKQSKLPANKVQKNFTINKIEEVKDYQQQYLQGEAYYQQPFNDFFKQNKRPPHNISPKAHLQNNKSIWQNHANDDYQNFIYQVQGIINNEIKSMQMKQLKGNYVLEHVTDDLEIELEQLLEKTKSPALTINEMLKIRMHVQAVSKIMVFVHGKSEFRLVTAHYYIGEAYRLNSCFQQAIDHFTIALKKNAKLTEIKQTKIYHSFILTSLSQCYFQLQMYSDSLQILMRAYDIQQCYVNSELKINNIKTIRLISSSNLKMRNYRQAVQYMQKILLLVQKLHGSNSQLYAQMRFQKAVILGEQGNLIGAIEEVRVAIELVETNHTIQQLTKRLMMLQYNKKLAQFLDKFGDFESQVTCLRQMLNILCSQQLRQSMSKQFYNLQLIAIKKKIIVIAINHGEYHVALPQLQEVLALEEEKYVSHSSYIIKTLKMLGLVHLHVGNQLHAQQYFKKCDQLNKLYKQTSTNQNTRKLYANRPSSSFIGTRSK